MLVAGIPHRPTLSMVSAAPALFYLLSIISLSCLGEMSPGS